MSDWEPATEAEAALRDALHAGDRERYFTTLARIDLLLPVSGESTTAHTAASWGTWTTGGRTHVLAFTSAESMRASLTNHAGSARRVPYHDLAAGWPNQDWWLAVNPGLPVEGFLPAWFVAQLARGDVRLPGRTIGARARVEAGRIRAVAPSTNEVSGRALAERHEPAQPPSRRGQPDLAAARAGEEAPPPDRDRPAVRPLIALDSLPIRLVHPAAAGPAPRPGGLPGSSTSAPPSAPPQIPGPTPPVASLPPVSTRPAASAQAAAQPATHAPDPPLPAALAPGPPGPALPAPPTASGTRSAVSGTRFTGPAIGSSRVPQGRTGQEVRPLADRVGRARVRPAGAPTNARTDAARDPAFVPANEVEVDLLSAASEGQTDGFLSTLLLARVVVPVAPGGQAGALPGDPGFSWRHEERDGQSSVVVFTSLARMEEHLGADAEAVTVKFVQLIRAWPDESWSFTVNPGTPVSASLPGSQIRALATWAVEMGLGGESPDADEAAAEPREQRQRPVVMQKPIAPSQVAYFLDRGYDRVAGFVHRASEAAHLTTPEQLYAALGLGYPGSPFRPSDEEVHVLRWAAHRPDLYRIPYGGRDEAGRRAMRGWVIERAPFRGNGFAPSESAEVIAEFKVDSVRLPHGAEMWRMNRHGEVALVAVFDADGPRWTRVARADHATQDGETAPPDPGSGEGEPGEAPSGGRPPQAHGDAVAPQEDAVAPHGDAAGGESDGARPDDAGTERGP